MIRFAQACESVAATPRKTEKVRIVADYLASLSIDDAAIAALFFCGRAFPRYEERVLSVGGSAVWQAVARVAGAGMLQSDEIYRRHGDLGAATEELLRGHEAVNVPALGEIAGFFAKLAAERAPAARGSMLEAVLRRAGPLAAKYIIKIVTSELRIGLKESLVEEAIARAWSRPIEDVRRANMLTGDIANTLRMAAQDTLNEAKLTLFRPVDSMLASPIESAAEALDEFSGGALVEDKFDGIRAQAHKSDGRVKLYSRTLDQIVEFHELEPLLAALPGDFVLDGEIAGWRGSRTIPFTELQKRLGRKHAELWLPLEIPAAFIAFDLLYFNGQSLLDSPLARRRELLADLLDRAEGPLIQLAKVEPWTAAEGLERAFADALARGNEGIVIKDPASLYTPGRRGRAWLKWKQPLATLDVVVTYVEYGHGKRRGLLSDYTFAVRSGDRLLEIGKAYSGLTDEEIRQMTAYFLDHTIEDYGFRRKVDPDVVIEVAFNNIQQSKRHSSGYALRFPRIVRRRPDKRVEEIDTIERVAEIFRRQS